MELTPIFNDAAQGGAGHSSADGGPHSPRPSGPSAAEAPIHAANEQTSTREATARQFEAATQPAPTVTNEATETVSEKEANLRMLERGRAKPKAQLNLKPSPHVEKAVHTMTEAWREKFIRELQGELAATSDLDERFVLDAEFDDDFGPTF